MTISNNLTSKNGLLSDEDNRALLDEKLKEEQELQRLSQNPEIQARLNTNKKALKSFMRIDGDQIQFEQNPIEKTKNEIRHYCKNKSEGNSINKLIRFYNNVLDIIRQTIDAHNNCIGFSNLAERIREMYTSKLFIEDFFRNNGLGNSIKAESIPLTSIPGNYSYDDYKGLFADLEKELTNTITEPTAEAKAKAENLALRLDEKERLTKALSVLNKDQITVVQYLWEKYKGLEQFQGTAEMKKAGVTGYNGFAALFLSTKDKQHKDFYKNTFISKKDDSRMRKGYYKFSVHFQEQILETNHPI